MIPIIPFFSRALQGFQAIIISNFYFDEQWNFKEQLCLITVSSLLNRHHNHSPVGQQFLHSRDKFSKISIFLFTFLSGGWVYPFHYRNILLAVGPRALGVTISGWCAGNEAVSGRTRVTPAGNEAGTGRTWVTPAGWTRREAQHVRLDNYDTAMDV